MPAVGFFALDLLFCGAALFEGAGRWVGFPAPASLKVSFAAITALLLMCNQAETSMHPLGRYHSSSAAGVHRSLRVRVAAECHPSRSKPRPIGWLPDTRSRRTRHSRAHVFRAKVTG